MDRKYTGSRDIEVCEANLLMVAIYFRLPAIWDENFILNEERIRHNEVISKKTIKKFENFRDAAQNIFRMRYHWLLNFVKFSKNFLSHPLNDPQIVKN